MSKIFCGNCGKDVTEKTVTEILHHIDECCSFPGLFAYAILAPILEVLTRDT